MSKKIKLRAEDLYNCGMKFIEEKKYEEAYICFEKCYDLNPKHPEACQQLLLKCILSEDYDSSLQYVESLYDSNNIPYKKDASFFLYLLSFITRLPKKQRRIVNTIDMQDVKISSKNKIYKNIPMQNKVRRLALQRKFHSALDLLNGIIADQSSVTPYELITAHLLARTAEIEKVNRDTLRQLVQEKEYEGILSHLKGVKTRHILSTSEILARKLVKVILRIKNGEGVPKKEIFETNILYEAIKGNNYELALNLIEQYSYSTKGTYDILNALLVDLCALISQIDQGLEDDEVDETKETDKKFVKNLHDELLNGEGMILISPKDEEQRKSVFLLANDYPDIDAFYIGEDGDTKIALRYRPLQKGYVDIPNLLREGKIFYASGNYDACIENYLQVLKVSEPASFVYAELGLAYMRKRDVTRAISYLSVATYKSLSEGGKLDYTDLIAELQGVVVDSDRKPFFAMDVKEFIEDEYRCGIAANIEEVIDYILASNLDVVDACHELGLSEEETDIVKIIIARIYYSQSNYHKGDKFLREYEKSKNKTPFTLGLLEETRRRKRFYNNRVSATEEILAFTLKPVKSNKEN